MAELAHERKVKSEVRGVWYDHSLIGYRFPASCTANLHHGTIRSNGILLIVSCFPTYALHSTHARITRARMHHARGPLAI